MKTVAGRYYGFDALRASMMLLGIVFHLALPYAGGGNLRGYYLARDGSWVLRMFLIVHYFRMPVFFLLSGFFSSLLFEKRGARAFLHNRMMRLGLVWLSALAVLWLLMIPVSTYNHFAVGNESPVRMTWEAITAGRIDKTWLPDPPLHLWFLEYLLLFCFAAAAIALLWRQHLPILDRYTGKVIHSKFRILLFALPTFATRQFMPFAVVPYPASLIPWLGVSLEYGWYYAVGWLLYRRRDLMPQLTRTSGMEKAAVPIFIVIGSVLLAKRANAGIAVKTHVLDLPIALTTALLVWSIIVVLMGATRGVKQQRGLTYLADSSYWIYLAHFPLTCLMPALLRSVQAPPVIKVAFSTLLILALLLAFYSQFVRYTWVGRLLNGTRLRNSPTGP